MLDRHLLRSIALQSLFEWDSRLEDHQEDLNEILLKNIEEFAGVKEIPIFIKKIISCLEEKRGDIDNIIQKAAPQWPLDKIPTIDRNILRLGICELLFSDRNEVPPKVAINEAIELSKAFGGENSGKFVSGVMGTIYKELGEPQKHETSESRKKEVDPKSLPVQELTGVMIYSLDSDGYKVMMVHNIFGYWTLMKGKEKEGLSSKESILKKTKRKIGLDIEIQNEIGKNEYIAFHTDYGQVKRKTAYYLAEANFSDLVLIHDEQEDGPAVLDDVRWFGLSEIKNLELYEDLRPVIEKGIKILEEKN